MAQTTPPNMHEFDGHNPIKGLEFLGRHVRDTNGAPSGSPANFERLRALPDESEVPVTPEEIAAQDTALVELFGAVTILSPRIGRG